MKVCIVIVLMAILPAALSLYGPLEFALGLSDNAKFYIMCQHNRIREQVAKGLMVTPKRTQPPAANMQALCWCEELVPKAQQHASNCGGQPHDNRAERKTPNFPDVGQSLMDCMKSSPIDEAMQGFSEEANGYIFETNFCDTANAGRAHVCGHYTALVWAETQCLGCAYDRCDGSNSGRLVCNYGPGGNIEGKAPYINGTACTQCSSGQLCLNGALCSDPVICNDRDRCSPPPSSSDGSASASCRDKNPSCAAFKENPSVRICANDSPYLLFSQDSCRATCNWCGGVSPGKVCAKAFNVSNGLCEKLTTVDTRECMEGNGLNYAGTASSTASGKTCIPWSTNDARTNYYNDFEFPDRSKVAAKNYCRNPASSGTGPWCYLSSGSTPSWEYCNIPKC